jgi:hypothetical protein
VRCASRALGFGWFAGIERGVRRTPLSTPHLDADALALSDPDLYAELVVDELVTLAGPVGAGNQSPTVLDV